MRRSGRIIRPRPPLSPEEAAKEAEQRKGLSEAEEQRALAVAKKTYSDFNSDELYRIELSLVSERPVMEGWQRLAILTLYRPPGNKPTEIHDITIDLAKNEISKTIKSPYEGSAVGPAAREQVALGRVPGNKFPTAQPA